MDGFLYLPNNNLLEVSVILVETLLFSWMMVSLTPCSITCGLLENIRYDFETSSLIEWRICRSHLNFSNCFSTHKYGKFLYGYSLQCSV